MPSTFDPQKIRLYMENSEISSHIVSYLKSTNPHISDAAAKEIAVFQAELFCHSRWKEGATDEAAAWASFVADIRNGRCFGTK